MTFDSMTFLWIVLPIILILYYITKNKYKNMLLLIASIIIYAWGSFSTLSILCISIIINYIIGIFMDNRTKTRKFIFRVR